MIQIFINYFTNIAKYSIGNTITTNTIAHRHQVKKEIIILFAFLSMTSKAFPEDKPINECPEEHPYSFLQNNRCCSSNKEGILNRFQSWCNQRILGDGSICCDGDSIECPNKPCSDYLTRGKKSILFKLCTIYIII